MCHFCGYLCVWIGWGDNIYPFNHLLINNKYLSSININYSIMIYYNERGSYFLVGNIIVYTCYCIKTQEDADKSVSSLSNSSGYNWKGKYTDSAAPNGFYY